MKMLLLVHKQPCEIKSSHIDISLAFFKSKYYSVIDIIVDWKNAFTVIIYIMACNVLTGTV